MNKFIEIDLDDYDISQCMVNLSEISHMKLNQYGRTAALYMKNGQSMCIKKYSYEKLLKEIKENNG